MTHTVNNGSLKQLKALLSWEAQVQYFKDLSACVVHKKGCFECFSHITQVFLMIQCRGLY